MLVLLIESYLFRSSARKPRKAKSDCDEVAHPAHLSVPHSEEVDSNEVESTTSGHTSKRRLYNAKCPDILLPSTEQVIFWVLKRVCLHFPLSDIAL